ncbi:MAG: hypothetical protein SGJ02_01715 [bacterium]|nr:hypothetical protein [bacterium]
MNPSAESPLEDKNTIDYVGEWRVENTSKAALNKVSFSKTGKLEIVDTVDFRSLLAGFLKNAAVKGDQIEFRRSNGKIETGEFVKIEDGFSGPSLSFKHHRAEQIHRIELSKILELIDFKPISDHHRRTNNESLTTDNDFSDTSRNPETGLQLMKASIAYRGRLLREYLSENVGGEDPIRLALRLVGQQNIKITGFISSFDNETGIGKIVDKKDNNKQIEFKFHGETFTEPCLEVLSIVSTDEKPTSKQVKDIPVSVETPKTMVLTTTKHSTNDLARIDKIAQGTWCQITTLDGDIHEGAVTISKGTNPQVTIIDFIQEKRASVFRCEIKTLTILPDPNIELEDAENET